MAADHIERGKLAYKSGKYDEAVKFFGIARTSAIRPQDVLAACDLQVGALVKTKKIEPAIDVAKAMVRMNRKDARGYVRAAQIERLAERPLAATRWYQHGLKHVSPSDSLYPALQSGLKKCDAQIVQETLQSKPCDPFMTLPVEVARMVLSYFDYRQTTAVLRVSKAWRAFLTKEMPLTNMVDFSTARRPVTVTGLAACLRRLKQYPKTAHLSNLTGPAKEDMQRRLPRWLEENTLEKLVLPESVTFPITSLPKSANLVHLDVALSPKDSPILLWKCDQLRRLDLKYTEPQRFPPILQHSYLEDLRMTSTNCHTSIALDLRLPNVRRLFLNTLEVPPSFARCPALRVLNLTRCCVRRDIPLPSELTDLSLNQIWWEGQCNYTPEQPLLLPNLVNLRAPLHEWSLSLDCIRLDPLKVETIDINDSEVTDSHVSMFANLTTLRRFTIRDGHRLTGIFVKDLIEQSSGSFEYIGMVNCEKVSHSTSTWAQTQHGVKVEIKNTADEASGRNGRRVHG